MFLCFWDVAIYLEITLCKWPGFSYSEKQNYLIVGKILNSKICKLLSFYNLKSK